MPPYAPTSRRPISAGFRKTAHGAVRWCVRRGVHPNTISYASVAAAAGAATCFLLAARLPWLLLVAPPLMWLRLYCNMLDGMVALESGKASPAGEIVNELPDRVSDVLIFAAIAHGGLAAPAAAYWAALAAVMTAYVGTLAQAVGGKRRFEGWMPKQARMVALSLGSFATFAMTVLNDPGTAGGRAFVGPFAVLDWTNLLIVAGCVQTCYIRLKHTVADLSPAASDSPAHP